MNLAIISDSFIPERTSCAIQLYDLSREFIDLGHSVTVITPSNTITNDWENYNLEGIEVIKLKSWMSRNMNFFRRAVAEISMPFFMIHNFKKVDKTLYTKWDYILWYSPSIFHGPFINSLIRKYDCKSYLILRDVFPQWAKDIGLLKFGFRYVFFLMVARYQYNVADIIGLQSDGNKNYFKRMIKAQPRKVEILSNWLGQLVKKPCDINLDQTKLKGKKVFVYSGNMGLSQGVTILIDLATLYRNIHDVGFLFVGRGSQVQALKKMVRSNKLDNVLFFDEIEPDQIPGLLSQCVAGLLTLDTRHKSHNIPGKFICYVQNSLPTIAAINQGNDLISLIEKYDVGTTCVTNNPMDLFNASQKLLHELNVKDFSIRCKKLFAEKFSVNKAATQIISSLSKLK